jgi:glycosyltransferase involved in cell wall biosynthesis
MAGRALAAVVPGWRPILGYDFAAFPMRVLRVADISRSTTAGMSGAMLRSGESLEALGHDVRYLFRDDLLGPRWSPQTRRLAVPVALCARVRRHHRQHPLDVVEIHEPLAGMYALLAASRWGRRHLPPCVVMSHGLEERCWHATLECRALLGVPTSLKSRISVATTLVGQARLALRFAGHVVVLNHADRDHLVSIRGLSPHRVSIVPNGVDPGLFDVPRSSAGHLRALFLGAWLERKGVGELVDAWKGLHAGRPSARLTIAGTGSASSLDYFPETCRDSISCIPHVPREELPGLLASHDVLVMPSWFEGMPLVALEAAAAGLAVVATRIPGVVDVFRSPRPESDGGILIDRANPDQLVVALDRLVADPEMLSGLQTAARRRASELPWSAAGLGFATAYRSASRKDR